MHLGMFLQCEYGTSGTDREAFEDALALVETAEDTGLDEVWIAELHFASTASPQQGMTAGRVPSIASAPLVLAAALATRTSRLRIGIGVSLLPLVQPVRLAEEVATVDQLSRGRLDLGVGRSAFPIAYAGYGISYEESRERFDECLEVLMRAWGPGPFSYSGRFYQYENVLVVPQPYQRPHPPVCVAASTPETFPRMGRDGRSICVLLGSAGVTQVAENTTLYHQAWKDAGHPGQGDVLLRVPVYVAETEQAAREEPRASTEPHYRRLAERIVQAAQVSAAAGARAGRAEELSRAGYDDLLRDRLAYGTPETVAARLLDLKDRLGVTGFMIEPNVGGAIPRHLVRRSVRLFAEEVGHRLRAAG